MVGDWIKKYENGDELNFNFIKQTFNSMLIFVISCLSMLIKIELNFLIIYKFHYAVNKRLFSLFYFLVYVIFISFLLLFKLLLINIKKMNVLIWSVIVVINVIVLFVIVLSNFVVVKIVIKRK